MANWKYKLDVSDIFHSDLSFEQIRDRTVKRIAGSPFYKRYVDFGLDDILDLLADSENESEFNLVWDDFYDWCDEDHRVWVTTRTSSLSENL